MGGTHFSIAGTILKNLLGRLTWKKTI